MGEEGDENPECKRDMYLILFIETYIHIYIYKHIDLLYFDGKIEIVNPPFVDADFEASMNNGSANMTCIVHGKDSTFRMPFGKTAVKATKLVRLQGISPGIIVLKWKLGRHLLEQKSCKTCRKSVLISPRSYVQ